MKKLKVSDLIAIRAISKVKYLFALYEKINQLNYNNVNIFGYSQALLTNKPQAS